MLIIVLCIYHDYYSCENCTKSFARSDQLKRHVRSGVCSKYAEFFGHMNSEHLMNTHDVQKLFCSILFYHIFSMQDILAKFLMIKCRVAFRIHFLRFRIRIQHLRMTTNPDPDPIRIQGFHDQKSKKITAEIFFIFFDQKLQLTYPQASRKYVQVIGEAFSSQRRPSNTSKHELLKKIFYFCGSFLPSWIRIRIPNLDPDPQTRLNPDPIRIRNPVKMTLQYL